MSTKFHIGMVSITIAAIASLTFAVGVTQSQSVPEPVRVIVTFDHEVNAAARAALENAGGQVLKEFTLINGAVVVLPSQAAAAQVGVIGGVRTVEQDVRVFALGPPGACSPWPDCKGGGDEEPPAPPAQELPWGVDRIDAEKSWSASRGAGVDVAVIDTGIDQDHSDLITNLKGGVNFVAKNWRTPADPAKWDDDNGHGTHVAGTIAAADNSEGVVGVAPEANLWAVKVLNRQGSGYMSDVISGIEWATQNGMEVISMSLGASSGTQALQDAVDAANAAGLIVVAAAGNSGDGNPLTNDVNYPAKYASVIAVGATAADDSVPSWSSDGAEVEIAAPGVAVKSTWNDGGYNTISGTSMATPHVSGVAALMLAAGVPASSVRGLLLSTADDLGAPGRDVFYGYGLLDAQEAVTGVQSAP